jgi:hypothetical protein
MQQDITVVVTFLTVKTEHAKHFNQATEAHVSSQQFIMLIIQRQGWKKLLKEAEAHPGL